MYLLDAMGIGVLAEGISRLFMFLLVLIFVIIKLINRSRNLHMCISKERDYYEVKFQEISDRVYHYSYYIYLHSLL